MNIDFAILLIILLFIFSSQSQSLNFDGELKLFDKEIILSNSDILQCEVKNVEKNYKAENFQILKTNISNSFKYFPINPEVKCVRFSVRAPLEVSIALASSNKQEVFEFFLKLGYKETTESKIRRIYASKDSKDSQHYITPEILSAKYFHEFWITWNTNTIKFGREGDILTEHLMTWNDTDMFDANFMGIRSSRSTGEWIFKEPVCPIDLKEFSPTLPHTSTVKAKCLKSNKEDGYVMPEIRFQNHLLDQLNSDFEYFRNNKNKNTKIYLEKYLNDLDDSYTKAKDFHDKILLNLTVDKNQLNEYLKSQTFNSIRIKYFEFYQYLEENVKHLITEPEKFEKHVYFHRPGMPKGCFYFNITLTDEIHVKLTTDKGRKIEIYIGDKNNSISTLSSEHNHRFGIVIYETMNNISFPKSEDNFGFWIKWQEDGIITVGKNYEKNSFVSYKISEMSPVEVIELKSSKNSYLNADINEGCFF